MRKQKGFSLIELLIVVAIILIIAAIAIPNLLRSRIAANEASAVGSVRTIVTADMTYASTYPDEGYAATLGALGGATCTSPTSAAACLIDNTLSLSVDATHLKSGYFFTAAGTGAAPRANFLATAEPGTKGTSGVRAFAADNTGVLKYNTDAATPTAADYADASKMKTL